ncbi:hypothetical protein GCM10010121_098500 [Streptomyces brasiliensis]|uniref:IstB-like ATP-binding domain-containing protein n=1 Tax=Streptomyces brasiliensis TaxID=1954 RepID=A0A917PDT9_9ACTN|nr:hypothetical protein GCM10010121_098500 [Streptomyces brasiliensis]
MRVVQYAPLLSRVCVRHERWLLDANADQPHEHLDVRHLPETSSPAALKLLEIEIEATEARRLAARERFACLPEPWTLSDFDFSAQPGVEEKLIRDLATLRFLDDASNVLFVGPPGVGKTMRRSRSAGPRSTPATGSTSPPRQSWRPSATRTHSKDGGRPACASLQVPGF